MQQPSDLISNTSQGYKISMTFGLVTQDELLEILELPKGASVPASVIKSEQVTLENHVWAANEAVPHFKQRPALRYHTLHSSSGILLHCFLVAG